MRRASRPSRTSGTLLDDQVPYIILGDFGTVCWYSADMIPDRQGVDMYWWNSYFKAD